MSSTLFTAKKSSFRELADLLMADKAFHNSGKTFTGETWGYHALPQQGRMSNAEYLVLADRNGFEPIEYVVRSYGTVIGYRWMGTWYVSGAKYSVTTSAHQSKFATAVSTLGGSPTVRDRI